MRLRQNWFIKVELGLTGRDMSVSSEAGQGRGSSRLILDAALKYQNE